MSYSLENSTFYHKKLDTSNKDREEMYLRALMRLHGKNFEKIRKELGFKAGNSVGLTVKRKRNNPKVIRYFEDLAAVKDVDIKVKQPTG